MTAAESTIQDATQEIYYIYEETCFSTIWISMNLNLFPCRKKKVHGRFLSDVLLLIFFL